MSANNPNSQDVHQAYFTANIRHILDTTICVSPTQPTLFLANCAKWSLHLIRHPSHTLPVSGCVKTRMSGGSMMFFSLMCLELCVMTSAYLRSICLGQKCPFYKNIYIYVLPYAWIHPSLRLACCCNIGVERTSKFQWTNHTNKIVKMLRDESASHVLYFEHWSKLIHSGHAHPALGSKACCGLCRCFCRAPIPETEWVCILDRHQWEDLQAEGCGCFEGHWRKHRGTSLHRFCPRSYTHPCHTTWIISPNGVLPGRGVCHDGECSPEESLRIWTVWMIGPGKWAKVCSDWCLGLLIWCV